MPQDQAEAQSKEFGSDSLPHFHSMESSQEPQVEVRISQERKQSQASLRGHDAPVVPNEHYEDKTKAMRITHQFELPTPSFVEGTSLLRGGVCAQGSQPIYHRLQGSSALCEHTKIADSNSLERSTQERPGHVDAQQKYWNDTGHISFNEVLGSREHSSGRSKSCAPPVYPQPPFPSPQTEPTMTIPLIYKTPAGIHTIRYLSRIPFSPENEPK